MQSKQLFFFVILMGISSLMFAEKYNVLHVKGEIRLDKTKTVLVPGDVIDSEDKVIFGSGDALAALFSPTKGRFTLSPNKKDTEFGDEFIAYVKSSLFPAKKGLSTRAAGMLKNEIEVAQHFGQQRYLILGMSKVRVAEEVYPLHQNAFFYLRFECNGEQVNKQLRFEEDKVILNADQILQVDGVTVKGEDASSFQMYYYDAESTVSQRICEFDPVFPDEEAMITSLEGLKNAMVKEGKSAKEIRAEINGFVAEYYGTTDQETLSDWLSLNLEL